VKLNRWLRESLRALSANPLIPADRWSSSRSSAFPAASYRPPRSKSHSRIRSSYAHPVRHSEREALPWLLFFWAAPKEAFFCESLLRVLAIQDGGDNSLFLQASGSNSFAGFSAPLNKRPCSRRIPGPSYTRSRSFSSFVVTGTVMLNSYNSCSCLASARAREE
jgi:hypothetical protein